MQRTRPTLWRGSEVPAHVHHSCSRFPRLRGDETLTEQIADALGHGSDHCIVVEHHDLERDTHCLAIVLEEHRFAERRWTVETVAAFDDPRAHHRLLDSVLSAPGSPPTVTWRPPSLGMTKFPIPARATVERTVLELRGPTPLAAALPAGVRLEAADTVHCEIEGLARRLVAVNNAAFGTHPDQGGLTADDVQHRFRSSWFDPSLLLFATHDGADIGFVWMKHRAGRPVELYVVGVVAGSPVRGMGRSLVTHGFAAAKRAHPHGPDVAMLFVDQSNAPATALYRSLGFRPVRRQDIVGLVRG